MPVSSLQWQRQSHIILAQDRDIVFKFFLLDSRTNHKTSEIAVNHRKMAENYQKRPEFAENG